MKPKVKSFPSLPKNPSLQQLLSHHIAVSGLTNREIAAACGLGVPNMVTMIKRGHSRLPLERLGPMARTLGIDTYDLFCRWMAEYYSETWRDLAPLLHRATVKSTSESQLPFHQ